MNIIYKKPAATVFCRISQFFIKLGMYLLPWKTPEIIRGKNASAQLPSYIRQKGLSKVLIVTGPNVRKHGLLDPMTEEMKKADTDFIIFDGCQPDPTDVNVTDGLKLFMENHCDCIIAFGGGSPMDCAKAIAAMAARPAKTIRQLQGLFRVRKKTPPVFAVPTTSGTGSETTIAAVITDSSTHHKASINDPALMPKAAVLDPALTIGLPPSSTASTGFDALCHAVECYTNGKYNTKLENELAEKAVRLIYENLYKAYTDGSDIIARQNMQEAAFCAGRAFTRGCVGYVHAIGHALGSLYGIPHGLAMAVILPHVMRKFGTSAEQKLACLAEICGIDGKNNSEKAGNFICWMESVGEKMNIPRHFPQIEQKDFPLITKWALKESNPVYPVPEIWGKKALVEILTEIKGPETDLR